MAFFYDPPPPLPLIAMIRIVPTQNLSYADLPFTEQDKTKVVELITFLAEKDYATLLWREDHVRHLGQQINSVYPLKFLAGIMKHAKSQFKMLFDDTLKKNAFMTGKDGLSVNLDREAQKGTLQQYMAPFAEDLGVSLSDIESYFARQDWYGLVSFLLYR